MTPREKRLKELEPIAQRHGATIQQVLSRKRNAPLVRARRSMAKHLFYKEKWNYSEIARLFSTDHSSIMYLIRTQNSLRNVGGVLPPES